MFFFSSYFLYSLFSCLCFSWTAFRNWKGEWVVVDFVFNGGTISDGRSCVASVAFEPSTSAYVGGAAVRGCNGVQFFFEPTNVSYDSSNVCLSPPFDLTKLKIVLFLMRVSNFTNKSLKRHPFIPYFWNHQWSALHLCELSVILESNQFS